VSRHHPLFCKGGDLMLEVKVRNNNVEKAIRQLKKKVMKEGILKEVKMRQYYEKPTLKRQRKEKENLKRINKLKRQNEKFL
tara:strand:+ start:1661 stop:1903 length:243 start_codon:yes stop_codon:yes gene_type:complete